MEFHSPDHVYRCIPGVLGLRERFDQQTLARESAIKAGVPEDEAPTVDTFPKIGLRGVFKPEIDKGNIEAAVARADLGPDKLAEFSQKQRLDLLRSKFAYVEDLIVGGVEVKTFDDFYRLAPAELVLWFENAVFSTEILTGAERKNS